MCKFVRYLDYTNQNVITTQYPVSTISYHYHIALAEQGNENLLDTVCDCNFIRMIYSSVMI